MDRIMLCHLPFSWPSMWIKPFGSLCVEHLIHRELAVRSILCQLLLVCSNFAQNDFITTNTSSSSCRLAMLFCTAVLPPLVKDFTWLQQSKNFTCPFYYFKHIVLFFAGNFGHFTWVNIEKVQEHTTQFLQLSLPVKWTALNPPCLSPLVTNPRFH